MKRYWTPAEDAAIIDASASDADLAEQTGRSVSALRQRRWKLKSGRTTHDWRRGRPSNVPEDVWKFVQVGRADECWPYTGAKRRRGYGAFSLQHRSIPAQRAAFMAATGIDPTGYLVCHTCDNPPCCNPAHLFLGTPTDNVRDMLAKGRGRPPRGERHHWSKLTENQVAEIRSRRASGERVTDIARDYPVGESRISVVSRTDA